MNEDTKFGIIMILLSPLVYLWKFMDWLRKKARE